MNYSRIGEVIGIACTVLACVKNLIGGNFERAMNL